MILTGENWNTRRNTLYSVGGRCMNEYGAMVEWYWQGKTEVMGKIRFPQHFPHHNSCVYVLARVRIWPSALKGHILPCHILGTCWCWLKFKCERRCYVNKVSSDRLRLAKSSPSHLWISPLISIISVFALSV